MKLTIIDFQHSSEQGEYKPLVQKSFCRMLLNPGGSMLTSTKKMYVTSLRGSDLIIKFKAL